MKKWTEQEASAPCQLSHMSPFPGLPEVRPEKDMAYALLPLLKKEKEEACDLRG